MGEMSVRWGIEWNKLGVKGMWSFGANIAHWDEETYLYINFGTRTLTIGWFQQEIKGEKS